MSSQKLPVLTLDGLERGMSTEVNDDYEEYLAGTPDVDFFFRIREYKREERNEIFVIGMVRWDRNPATWIDFPCWIKLE